MVLIAPRILTLSEPEMIVGLSPELTGIVEETGQRLSQN